MGRNNTVGIVGHIKSAPELVVDAADWSRKTYEATLMRMRPSGKEDTYILQFDGRAAGSKKMLDKIREGAEVLIGGEIRTENVHNPQPEENRVKIYLYAEVIMVNDPPVNDQNEVRICGNICRQPHFRTTHRRTADGRQLAAASIIVAVNTPDGTDYIPCVCFNQLAFCANTLKIGDYVEIYGRFQSRDFKKRVKGQQLPFRCTAYEVCVVRMEHSGKIGDTAAGDTIPDIC